MHSATAGSAARSAANRPVDLLADKDSAGATCIDRRSVALPPPDLASAAINCATSDVMN